MYPDEIGSTAPTQGGNDSVASESKATAHSSSLSDRPACPPQATAEPTVETVDTYIPAGSSAATDIISTDVVPESHCMVVVGVSKSARHLLDLDTCEVIKRIVEGSAEEYNSDLTSDPSRKASTMMKRVASALYDTLNWKTDLENSERVKLQSESLWRLVFEVGKGVMLVLWLATQCWPPHKLYNRRPAVELFGSVIEAGWKFAKQTPWHRLTSIMVEARLLPARISGALGTSVDDGGPAPEGEDDGIELAEWVAPESPEPRETESTQQGAGRASEV
jgi:hypothetical protein